MATETLAEVEARTQELGRDLYGRLQAYRPQARERLQDRLMVLLMEDQTLRNRLLRFVDVLASLTEDRRGSQTASLFREYFGADFGPLPWALRLALGLGRSPIVPGPLLAWSARRGTRLFASRFIVPPGPLSVGRAIQRLEEGGRYPSFDLLGEAVVSDEEARQYRQGYLDLLERLGRHQAARRRTPGGAPALQVSLKLSSLTAQFNPADPAGTLRRVGPALEELCLAAQARGIGVTVDAEQYAYRDLIWRIVQEVLAAGGPLGDWPDGGMVVQAYLDDAAEHARGVIAFARRRGVPFQVRLVKGAYWDYEVIVAEQNGWPVPVHRDKGATDITFERLVRLFLEEPSPLRLAVASHNIRSHAYAEAVREAQGLPAGALEHQTLYRTLEALSRALAQMGWPARDYVPVGALIPGMAYLVRRILENTSQVGFLTKTRLREDVADLLAPPHPGPEDLSHRRPPHPTGFAGTPPARLFDAVELERFQQALAETRARWGAVYPLVLGSERLMTSQRAPSISPSHPDPSQPVGWVHLAGPEEAERAIALANTAMPVWAARPLEERAAIGLRAAEALRSRKEEVAAWVVHEGAKNWPGALADVEEAIDHIAWSARQLQRLARRIQDGYRPVGVVACIPPWNFPIALPAGMVSAALMAGNGVILKSAAATPIVAQALVDAFHKAGVPAEALIHLPGPGGTVGARLVESPDVDMVAFTGSREVGAWVYRTASGVTPRKGGIKRVVAEMGGKNAIVVFPDADLDEAVLGILGSAFGHAGQKCSACSRVLVHRQVADRLRRRLVEAARSLPIGPADDPATFINPVIDARARERIATYREVARQEGRVLLDAMDKGGDQGFSVGPLLVELDAARARRARMAQEEIFGPVLTLVPFDTEEEAVSLVNSTVYALTLGIFSRSPGTIVRMVRACHAGNIYVNREITGARVGIEPFGGYRLSGTGPKAGGEDYLLAFLTRRPPRDGEALRGTRPSGSFLPPLGEGDEAPSPSGERGEPNPGGPGLWGLPVPWQAPAQQRLRALREAGHRLANADRAALDTTLGGPGRAVHALEGFFGVLASAPEVTESQPTVAIPGQTTFIRWSTPRGVGLVAVDAGADPRSLAGLMAGGLLAGNGLLVAAEGASHAVAALLVETLHRAGVPADSLLLAPPAALREELAQGPFHFAAADLAEEKARSLYKVLGQTSAEEGQTWLKAFISVQEGPRPGEPDFLRRFAHPKVVAVKTLRHGAELELV